MWGSVPFHLVDFLRHPLNILGVVFEVGIVKYRVDMVKRRINAKHQFFASIRADITLLLQFVLNCLPVAITTKISPCHFLEIATFARKGVRNQGG